MTKHKPKRIRKFKSRIHNLIKICKGKR